MKNYPCIGPDPRDPNKKEESQEPEKKQEK